MDKRFVLALGLSLFVLLGWSAWVSKSQHTAIKEVTEKTPSVATSSPSVTPPPVAPDIIECEIPVDSLWKYAREKLEINFIKPQAAIKDVMFRAYPGRDFALFNGLLLEDKSLQFRQEATSVEGVTFVSNDAQKKVTKRFIFSKSSYDMWLEINVQNKSASALSIELPLILGRLDFSPRNPQATYQDVIVATKEKTSHFNAKKDLAFEQVKFLGLRDRYFCAIVQPEKDDYSGFIRKINNQGSDIGVLLKINNLASGSVWQEKFHIYLGPQDLHLLNKVNPGWSAIIYYGTFDFIAQLILQLLDFLQGIVRNWGAAIVLLSVLVYLILYPLTIKQIRSMKEMQAIQPKVAALRKLYKDNPQKLNKEVMQLYKDHKVNPLGGCLPMLLQMPIFIALWQAFQRSIALKGAHFLWIKDLSEPDRLVMLPTTWPIKEFNILPILTAVLMFAQQKISMPAGGEGAEQQKMMTIILPFIFAFAFYNMPSGWVLYFLVYSLLSFVFQYKLMHAK